MTFSGQAGNPRSTAGNMVAGFGSSVVRNQKSFSVNTQPLGSVSSIHFYVFALTSNTLIRALSRTRKFITTFRTR